MVKPHGNMRGGVIYALNEQNQYRNVKLEDIIRFIKNSVTDLVSNGSSRSCVFKSTLKNGITSNLYDYSNKQIRELAFKLVFHSTKRVTFEIAGTNKVSELNETNKLEYDNQKKIDDLFTNINIVPQVAVYINDTTTVNNFLNAILNNATTNDEVFFHAIVDIISQPKNVQLSMMIMEYIPEKYEDLYNFRYKASNNNKLPIYESICQYIVACLIIIRERLKITNADLHTGNILIDSELINQTAPIPPHELFDKVKIIDWGVVTNVTPITPVDTNTYIFYTMQQMVDENMYEKKYSQMKWLCSLLFKIIHTPILGSVIIGNETKILLSKPAKMEDELQELRTQLENIKVKLRTQLENIKVNWSEDYEKTEEYKKYKESTNYQQYKDITKQINEKSDKLSIFESKSVISVTFNLEDPEYDSKPDPVVTKLREFCHQVHLYKNAIEKQIVTPFKKTQIINQENNSRKKARV